MKLMNEGGAVVLVGDTVTARGQEYTVTGICKPHKPSSTGRLQVQQKDSKWHQEFFPSVFGCTWVGRTDR